MNKGQLVEQMATGAGISKAAAERALNAFMDAVMDAVATGDKVTLVGFGTFYVTERKARTGRNPQTGKKMKIPARKVVKFRPGSRLSDAVK
ncbi:MAG: HU family DNA-binding protein [Thermodesulfobacteria bacterium]|nr:HU family DNA-binding protein [Thermodesulfobacteriota bacterium]